MSFFSNFLKKHEKKQSKNENIKKPREITELNKVFSDIYNLLAEDRFISRRDYAEIDKRSWNLYSFFEELANQELISSFCKGNQVYEDRINVFLDTFKKQSKGEPLLSEIVRQNNEKFIRRHLEQDKDYLDTILKKSDPGILLDEEQRRVVLSDEDHTLVIAGAGAGKTTTIAAKVKYLVDKKGIDPKKILIVSYTNKAVEELKTRIKSLGIDCPITTFHSAGYAILRKNDSQLLQIVDSGYLFDSINEYLKSTILSDPEMVRNIILFFGSYFDVPFDEAETEQYFQKLLHLDTSTLKGNMPNYETYTYDRRSGKRITLQSEFVRSMEEVRIANFLYLNQIDYKYEDPYKYRILYSHKPYTPDFHISQNGIDAYIEHFGITENGENDRYNPDQIARYKKAIADKTALHRKHGTILLTTYSKYNDGKDFLIHLKEQLISKGFELSPRSYTEVYEQLSSNEENKYISKLVRLLTTFIINFKTNGYDESDFSKWMNSNHNVRTKLFLNIAEKCYLDYQRKLKEKNAVDFEDMINMSEKMLKDHEQLKVKIDFKYIIVDEYQDISRQRFNLTKTLAETCNAKIMAVGDDWQSIYAYAGSDITLFTQFSQSVGYADELKITRTYRNSQEVINIAGNFIQKNSQQIRKSLISSKHISNPVIIETYSEKTSKQNKKEKGGKYFGIGKAVEKALDRIFADNPKTAGSMKILLIGRYGFDARNLCYSKDFSIDEARGIVHSEKYKNRAHLYFLTAHRSKGLGFDNVIILNARDDVYGFPAKLDNDPVLKLVVHQDHSIDYAEERRLFYVALTRTKNKVYIITPEEHPSEFIRELIKDYGDKIVLDGTLAGEEESGQKLMKRCPVCGYPLQLRQSRNIGMKLWMCTNETEICDFISNDLRGGTMQIQKCNQCRDGYLIVKSGQYSFFLGCTNHRKDGTGCNATLSPQDYEDLKLREDIEGVFSDDSSSDKASLLIRESDEDAEIRSSKEKQRKREVTRHFGDVNKLVKKYTLSCESKDSCKKAFRC